MVSLSILICLEWKTNSDALAANIFIEEKQLK